MSEDTTKTTAKTLWTETILEILYESLRRNKGDSQVKDILNEIRQKGFKRQYLIDKVKVKVSAEAAARVKSLLG